MNPFLATDGYKTGHHLMYPNGTSLVYSNFTPRSNRHAPAGVDHVVSFGQQMVMQQIVNSFDRDFFHRPKAAVCGEIKHEYSMYLGTDYDVSHIEALHDLGYLPLKVKTIPEGTLVPMGVPVLTIYNTNPEFYWLTNFLETLISNLLWKPITSATIAREYKKLLVDACKRTDKDSLPFVEFQGHDFSMRGMDSLEAVISSGLGHATSFLGSDSLPTIHGARTYYKEKDFVVGSVNATEHSVMCAGSKEDEIGTFRTLMNTFPTGILSVVSDTWDLWKVITEYLPELKKEILERDGKLVIRPDSGDPVDIICGYPTVTELDDELFRENNAFIYENKLCVIDKGTLEEYAPENGRTGIWEVGYDTFYHTEELKPQHKGVVELLWDIFGGTENEQGYKVLDSHIGAIYGDSITLDRAKAITERLEEKGFASTNIVLGIGSFTYQFNTRDTFGFAMKATYVEIDEEFWPTPESLSVGNRTIGREIFKDPVTDDGVKKSAKGLLQVINNNPNCNGGDWLNDAQDTYVLNDQVTWEQEQGGILQVIFEDGRFMNPTSLTEIRKILNEESYAL